MVALFSLILPGLLHQKRIPKALRKLEKITLRLYASVIVTLLHFGDVGEEILRHLLSDALLYYSVNFAKIVLRLRYHMIQLLLSRIRGVLFPLHHNIRSGLLFLSIDDPLLY